MQILEALLTSSTWTKLFFLLFCFHSAQHLNVSCAELSSSENVVRSLSSPLEVVGATRSCLGMCSRWQIAVAVILHSSFVWLSGARVLLHGPLTKKVDDSVECVARALSCTPSHTTTTSCWFFFLLVVLRATQPTYEQKHHFLCATSGFNSVSSPRMLELMGRGRSSTRPGAENVNYSYSDHDGCVDHRRRDACSPRVNVD